MPRVTIAQLRARIGELEKEVITARRESTELAAERYELQRRLDHTTLDYKACGKDRQTLIDALKIVVRSGP